MLGNWLLDGSRLNDRPRWLWGASAGTTSSLSLQSTRQLGRARTVAEFVVDSTEPVSVLLFAKPVVVTNTNHNAAQLSFPTLAVGAIDREGFAVDISYAGD